MPEWLPLALFGVVFAMLLFGFPVAFTLGGVSLIFGYFTFGLNFFQLLPLRIWGTMTNYVLIAVPLFVYMGLMLEKSGLAEELLETMALLFGRLRGGLAISVIVVGAVLAASTGIVGATVVTMGLLSLPTMLKRGYSPEMATGTICAAGTLGQIIPPSIVLVLLGSIMNISIGDMFIGAVIPGLVLVGLYMLYIVLIAVFRGQSAPAMPADELAAFKGMVMVRRIIRAFLLPFFLILAVLGSIFAGIASPTEAAAVGALGATLLTLWQKKFNLQTLYEVMKGTTILTCMVFVLLVGATAFGLVFRGLSGDHYITHLILESNMGPHMFLFIVMLVIFIAGFFIDFIEITFIIVPVVAPIFQHLGVDLLWIGILIAVNLQTSFLTPPFGFSLFYLKGVAPPEVTTGHIYRGIVPFIIIQLIGLLMIVLFPEMVTWLPRVMSG
ncbi:tripartite ATP-independent transporter DctM subunit [Geothermobacter ehrlichii]|uniref:Tripartite ATP-independent transporter DctM subunit n=1 Tax=Geothermobacter ehrlichii TaxID=213224 RepID=A0A5D3WI40_9BACT|nr:TRAP transporter large permease subunit [Geothermobacter ehrlichii]TYO98545.1 tripartite ATP-independent transporter DctM subunit [Geothermobacter ehrlichii]